MRISTTCFVLALFLSSFAFAGETGGSIKGHITTSEGLAAADVTVLARNLNKGFITDNEGNFTIRNLAAGVYELEISLIGYKTVVQSVRVSDNAVAEIDIRLELTQTELTEVIIRSGRSSYKTNTISSSLRLREPIIEAPQNIQIVNARALTDQQVISMSDGLIRNVSGAVRLEHWGDLYTNISSRGSQIQAFRNGFNVVNSYWGPLTEDMSFVDHIEFVKGPAGFMLANGDPSGLYNVVTKKPTGQTRGEVNFTTGSFGLYRSTLDLDGKLTKDGRLIYRLNLAGQNKQSFRPNEFNNRYSFSPVVSYQLDEKTKLTAEYNLQDARMSDVGSYYIFSTKGYATLPARFTTLPAGMPTTHIIDQNVYFNLQHKIDANWQLTAQLGYFDYDQNGTSMWPSSVMTDGTMIRAVSSWQAKSKMTLAQAFVNGEIATGQIRHRILAGLDLGNKQYFADWGQYHELDSIGAAFNTADPYYGVPVNGYPQFDYSTPIEQRAEEIGGLMDQRYTALYVQDELGFWNNKVRLTLAGRYTFVEQSEWGAAAESAKHFSPRLGVSASIDKQTSVYALYDQAFTPQNGTLSSGGKVRPITGNNIELGWKKEWAGGKWASSISIFRILKENELTADPNSPPTSGLSIVLGQKRSQGVELDIRGRISSSLNLVFNYALTDSRISKLAPGVTSMKEGDQLPGFAKHTANSWLSYQVQDGALKGLGLSAGFSYLADRHTYWDPSPAGGDQLPDYFKLDGGVSWSKEKISITANVFNILDTYLYSGSWYSWLNAYYWQAEAPRNIRFSIAYRF